MSFTWDIFDFNTKQLPEKLGKKIDLSFCEVLHLIEYARTHGNCSIPNSWKQGKYMNDNGIAFFKRKKQSKLQELSLREVKKDSWSVHFFET